MTGKQILFLACSIILIVYVIYTIIDIVKYRKNASYKVKEFNNDITEIIFALACIALFIFCFIKGF